jgi:hypothetical protein
MKRPPLLARADLLRALELAGDDDQSERRYAGLLAFSERQPVVGSVAARIPLMADIRGFVGPAPGATSEPEPGERLPAPLFAITACRRLNLPAEAEDTVKPSPLTSEQCTPRQTQGDAAPFVPLVRRTRLWPALKRSALELRYTGLDMPRLLRELTRARPGAAAAAPPSVDLGRRTGRRLGPCAASATLPGRFPGHRRRAAAAARRRWLLAVAGRRQPAAGQPALAGKTRRRRDFASGRRARAC